MESYKYKFVPALNELLFLLFLLTALCCVWPVKLWAEDTPPPEQTRGCHSTVSTAGGGSIRDDELAEMVAEQIQASGGQVKDVKIMIQCCFGGGFLDDFNDIFGPGGACEGIPWVATSACGADERSRGAGDWFINSNENKSKRLGNPWTNSLAGEYNSSKEKCKGTIQDSSTDNVKEDFEEAAKKDVAGPEKAGKENPVVASGNGGDQITWGGASKHVAVVLGGKQTKARHHNDIDNVFDALDEVWGFGVGNIEAVDGGTRQDCNNAIKKACSQLDADTQLVIYITGNGNREFDIGEFLWGSGSLHILASDNPLTEDFSLDSGWYEALKGMHDQIGDKPMSTLNVNLVNDVNSADWTISLNGTVVPLPAGTVEAGFYELPVEWTAIKTGLNNIQIFTGNPGASMEIDHLELSSGPINEGEMTEYAIVDNLEAYADKNELLTMWAADGNSAIDISTDIYRWNEQALRLDYNSTGGVGYATATRTYPESQDWLADGGEVLSVWFRGDPNIDQMYVELRDDIGGAAALADTNAITSVNPSSGQWQEMNLSLADFLGVDPNNVKEVEIGAGNSAFSGAGSICFDNLRIYPSRCLERPAGDFNDDCIVDFKDFAIFSTDWLKEGVLYP